MILSWRSARFVTSSSKEKWQTTVTSALVNFAPKIDVSSVRFVARAQPTELASAEKERQAGARRFGE